MGQYWELYNIDKQETSSSVGGKLGECFFNSHSGLELTLTLPIPDDRIQRLYAGTVIVGARCLLLSLPPEIHAMIFDALKPAESALDYTALVFLSVTCKTLLCVAEPYLMRCTTQAVAPWADGRIICVGDYCHYEDLPPGLFTDAEKAALASYARSDDEEEDGDDEDEDEDARLSAASAIRHVARETLPAPVITEEISVYELTRCLVEDRWDGGERDDAVSGADGERIAVVLAPAYPPRAELVVANISKGEYVRAPAVEALGRGKRLGHVVLARVCCSPDDSIAMSYRGGLTEGVWAGDRFRITTVERLPAPLCAGAWKDVTQEVCGELAAIWEADYEVFH